MNQQGLDYVRGQLDQGIDRSLVRQAMISSGWQANDVDQMIKTVEGDRPNIPLPKTGEAAVVSGSIDEPVSGNSNLLIKIILPIVVILGLAAGIYFLFFSPQRVLARMISKTNNITSLSYKASFNAEIKDAPFTSQPLTMMYKNYLNTRDAKKMVAGISTTQYNTAENPQSNNMSFNLNAEGQSDVKDTKNVKFSIKLDAQSKIGNETAEETSTEFRFLSNMFYLKVDKVPQSVNDYLDLTPWLGKWFKFDMKEINEATGEDLESNTLSDEQVQKIQKIYLQNQFVKVDKNTKMERVNGAMTFRYNYSLDKDKLKSFITEANKAMPKPESETSLKYTLDEVDNMPDITGQIWAGIFDSYPYKFNINFATKPEELLPFDGQFKFEASLKDFNKPVNIEEPKDAQSFEELMAEIETQMMANINKDTDNDGLTDYYEKYWKTDPNKADTDGDGYSDSDEICKGYDPTGPDKQTEDQTYLPLPEVCYQSLYGE